MTRTATFSTGPPWYDGDFEVCLTEVEAHPQNAKVKAVTAIERIFMGLIFVCSELFRRAAYNWNACTGVSMGRRSCHRSRSTSDSRFGVLKRLVQTCMGFLNHST